VYAGAQTRHGAACSGLRHKNALFPEWRSNGTTEAAKVPSIAGVARVLHSWFCTLPHRTENQFGHACGAGAMV
jgi:hypothetical protein